MQLVAAEVLTPHSVGRETEEGRELTDLADVFTLDVLVELPDRHVFDHATAQR